VHQPGAPIGVLTHGGERPIPCHNRSQSLAVTSLSVRGGSLRSRHIPCHIPRAEPKSLASVRVVPMCDQLRQAIARQLAGGTRPEDLVLPGPGGSNGIPRGARTPLSTTNLRRVYKGRRRGGQR
jgi:hypothetical protein